MKCKKCNTENYSDNQFCIQCGAELENTNSDVVNCYSCGAENSKSSTYCSQCGEKISTPGLSAKGRNNKKRKSNNQRKKEVLTFRGLVSKHKLLTAAFALFLLFLIYQIFPGKKVSDQYVFNNRDAQNRLINVISDSLTSAIAVKFECSCGECSDALDVCTCSTAKEERNFIKEKASQGVSEQGIILAVQNKFGGLKNEFVSELNNLGKSGLKAPAPDIRSGLKSQVQLESNDDNQIASLKDAAYIISKFSCPCGQCGIDELADCNCDHRGGAKEIKKYLNNTLLSGKKTIQQVISDLNSRFGGLKI